MPWLNWSLKVHFRLRTISLLISTHFTQEYVQRMSYSFVWLYLIKCVFTCSIFVDQHKKIFEYFSYFWKVFCFCKNVKNLKNSVALFWRLSRGLVQSHVPVASPYRNFSRLTGGSMSQSQKILRIFFKIWVFNVSHDSDWRLVCGWKLQSRGLHKNFRGFLRDFPASGTFSCEKHWDKFFKNFISGVSWLVLVNCFNRENRVFCILRVIFKVVFKNFSLFPHASLSLIIPSSLALYFLLDPFIYSCQKGENRTLM